MKQSDNESTYLCRDIFITTLIVLCLCIILFSSIFKIVKIEGKSMLPNIKNGNIILFKKGNRVKRFDVVVIKQGSSVKVSRIIALPGECFSYKDDVLFIDDQVVDEKFIVGKINDAQKNNDNYTPDITNDIVKNVQRIPKDNYLILNDNRFFDDDSRYYGLVSKKQIIGRGITILFPMSDLKNI